MTHTRSAWRYYLSLYQESWPRWSTGLGLTVLQSLMVIPFALCVKKMFDEVVPRQDLIVLAQYTLLLLLINGLISGMTLWSRFLNLSVIKATTFRLRNDLLRRCYTLPREYFSRTDYGRLHIVMVNDIERLDALGVALWAQIIPGLIVCLIITILLFKLNVMLTLLLVAVVPIALLINQWLKKRQIEANHLFRKAFKKINQGLWFVLNFIDLTRIQTAEKFEFERQSCSFEQHRQAGVKVGWLSAAYIEMQNGTVVLGSTAVIMIGGLAVAARTMSIGELISFFVALGLLSNALRQVWGAIPVILNGNESLLAVYNLLSTPEPPPYCGRSRLSFNGHITFDAVSFRYNHMPVLQDVSFSVSPGKMVGITGPNGAGKTTLIYLILGFYRPQSGRLYAEQVPFDDLDMDHLRKSIGVVLQQPMLFDGTIWENITYGCQEEINPASVELAGRLSTAHDFISQLPKGYHAGIGEHGVQLSGGQRQRLALARALFRRPKLLILDEPTTHLDTKAITQLMQNLRQLTDPPTIFLISHDWNILRLAHTVYTIREGRLQDSQEDMI